MRHAAPSSRDPLPPSPGRARRAITALLLCLVLTACQWLPQPADRPADQALGARLDASLRLFTSKASNARQRAQAAADYRKLLANNLPQLLQDAAQPAPLQAALRAAAPARGDQPGVYAPAAFTALLPVGRPRQTEPGLHREGLGLPLVGRIFPGGANAPHPGYKVPVTLLALPSGAARPCCDAALVNPERVASAPSAHGDLRVAMDLEAALDAAHATGPRRTEGVANLLRADRFVGRPRIIFMEPFDPDKVPVVLIHGLMSTPRTWAPLVRALLADPQIRAHYQFWFFFYPTSQPIPLSALQLRDALDDTVRTHGPHQPLILIGHSMGGILARAQVSRIDLEDAQRISPGIGSLPDDNPVRRSLVFAPRGDVSRVVFMFTPHRGSTLATNRLGAWGIRLARLPEWLIGELANYAHLVPDATGGRLPTSIHGLSPQSRFLRLLDQTPPRVPAHSIIGDRGRGPLASSSDGVVAYRSAHLAGTESELIVPAWHSGIAHPLAIAELRRILRAQVDPAASPPAGAPPAR